MTGKQIWHLRLLDDGPRTSRQLAGDMGVSRAGRPLTSASAIHNAMRRLEDGMLVRRAQTKPIRWELTHTGRWALEQATKEE